MRSKNTAGPDTDALRVATRHLSLVTISLPAEEVGFRMGPSMRERVAYREMFPFGLTIADLAPGVRPANVSSPRQAAREELRDLLVALRLAKETAEDAGERAQPERGAVLHPVG